MYVLLNIFEIDRKNLNLLPQWRDVMLRKSLFLLFNAALFHQNICSRTNDVRLAVLFLSFPKKNSNNLLSHKEPDDYLQLPYMLSHKWTLRNFFNLLFHSRLGDGIFNQFFCPELSFDWLIFQWTISLLLFSQWIIILISTSYTFLFNHQLNCAFNNKQINNFYCWFMIKIIQPDSPIETAYKLAKRLHKFII